MKEKIDLLISQGKTFTFANNSHKNQYGVYSKPSDEFLAWIVTVGDFIIQNFGENSLVLNCTINLITNLYRDMKKMNLIYNTQN